jgi:hypothetical protein
MNRSLRGLSLIACAAAFSAHTQPSTPQASAPSPQQAAGLESDWEMAAVLQEMSAHAGSLLPVLDQADAKMWTAKGAPETYGLQLQSCKEQARALADGAKALALNPEKLSAALEVLFREQGLETMLGSVAEAMRKYQSADAAQQLVALTAEGGASRDRLQRYVAGLAAEREKEYAVMDQEAQRCRGMVLAPPPQQKKKK